MVVIKSPLTAFHSSVAFHTLACPVGLGRFSEEGDKIAVSEGLSEHLEIPWKC